MVRILYCWQYWCQLESEVSLETADLWFQLSSRFPVIWCIVVKGQNMCLANLFSIAKSSVNFKETEPYVQKKYQIMWLRWRFFTSFTTVEAVLPSHSPQAQFATKIQGRRLILWQNVSKWQLFQRFWVDIALVAENWLEIWEASGEPCMLGNLNTANM